MSGTKPKDGIGEHFITYGGIEMDKKTTLVDVLGIKFTLLEKGKAIATMPVNERTHQPFGLLHGGASVALAETVGSVASMMCVDPERYLCVGQDINANHLRGMSSGT